jgi:hypothetical protein
MTKSTPRPRPPTRARKPPKPIDELKVEAILQDCAIAVGRGVGHRGSKEVSFEASEFWRRKFRPGIIGALREGLSWQKARKNALIVATHMGEAASDLEPTQVITEAAAKAAAEAAQTDPACPPPAPGSGRFCRA